MAVALPRSRRSALISGVNKNFAIRKAALADLDAIKVIADTYRRELGFVLRPALARSITRGEVLVAENSAGLIGFVEYRHRQDEQTTLYHIAVVSNHRQEGVGRSLVDALHSEAWTIGKKIILLKCPSELPAQGFYARLGFNSIGEEPGNKRSLIVWVLPLVSPSAVPQT